MGLFTKWYNEPRWKDVRALSQYTAGGGWFKPEYATRTCLKRLAHLIVRMESRPVYDVTVSASKWYLEHLDKMYPMVVRQLRPTVDQFAARLRRAIDTFEAETTWRWDSSLFGRHVDLVYDKPEAILYGPMSIYTDGFAPSGSTPEGKLARMIDLYCWPSSYWSV